VGILGAIAVATGQTFFYAWSFDWIPVSANDEKRLAAAGVLDVR